MEYFFLHCVKLEVFPIFGQHTYRSICFIKEMKIIEIPNTKKNWDMKRDGILRIKRQVI